MIQTKSISDGQRTKIIYTLIKDGKYQDVLILSYFRLLIISTMSFSFVQEVDLCHYWLIATL